ncbi:hypothetical protein RHSIM_Rhsim02G0236700 [Rhododendron simsii]|uniref:Membrane-associated kinase regulator 2 n=1 Tax=Rhododendron simsii TaxID=118357 RepID=A0A834HIR0_RHOSS|nr:hypothetical protein RHSIM_Rhsim02G0236700 [Rhododendron simsii]
MEAFSLLKYWRTTTGGGATANLRASTPTTTTTISTAISHSTAETDDDEEENGPFFDLEFAVPDEEDHDKQKTTDGLDGEREDEEGDSDGTDAENDARGEEEEEEEEGEFKFTLEPSDDLFFNGNLVPVEPSSMDDGSGQIAKPQFSLLKSASKFGVLMLKLKKSKQPNAGERTDPEAASVCLTKQSEKEAEAQTQKQKPSEKEAEAQTQKQKPKPLSKLFTVKFKVEEVPIVSLFTRDNSSRASSGTINNKSQKKETSDESGPDEKRVSKDGVQKYLKMVKPLYIRVSKRHGEKPSTGFSGQLSVQSPARPEAPKSEKTEAVAKSEPPAAVAKSEPPAAVAAAASCEEKSAKQGKLMLPAGLRVVCKHLGKSRSASSAAVAAAPVSGATVKQGRRRDDSLLEQQDGIQSAIMHCKRSFGVDSVAAVRERSIAEESIKLKREKLKRKSERHR